MKDLIRKLTEAFGPSGWEAGVREIIRAEIGKTGDTRVDPLGSLIARVPGKPGGRKVMLAAHMDEIGVVVTHIDAKGFLRFGNVGGVLAKRGIARPIDVSEGLDLLQQARARGLVQFGENVRNQVSFICNCCGCCCEALIAHRRFSTLHPVHTTNYLPVTDPAQCNGCGACVDACPVEAMTLVSANQPNGRPRRRASVDVERCLGCGVCVPACPSRGLHLEARPQRVLTPVDTTHKYVLMAIERGQLQNLLIDQQAFWHHRTMAAILGVILRLPPIKQAMATRQFRSRYLEGLIARARA